jgi:hypothetical protein
LADAAVDWFDGKACGGVGIGAGWKGPGLKPIFAGWWFRGLKPPANPKSNSKGNGEGEGESSQELRGRWVR